MSNAPVTASQARLDPRAAPTPAFIAAIRQRFPVESEIDRVLTRKMNRRSEPGYVALPLERLVTGTHALICARTGDNCTLTNPRWLQGGAAKLQMAFALDWCGPEGGARRTTPMVLRMEPPEAIVETSRRREFEMLGLMDGVVPVPRRYWLDADGDYLPYPALIYGFADGVTKPQTWETQQVTGVGTHFGPRLRPVLGQQFVQALAAIHTVPAARLGELTMFERAVVGSNASIVRQVHWWRRVWEEDRPEDLPLVNVASSLADRPRAAT